MKLLRELKTLLSVKEFSKVKPSTLIQMVTPLIECGFHNPTLLTDLLQGANMPQSTIPLFVGFDTATKKMVISHKLSDVSNLNRQDTWNIPSSNDVRDYNLYIFEKNGEYRFHRHNAIHNTPFNKPIEIYKSHSWECVDTRRIQTLY